LILNESELSHKAAADSLPLRDAFAVLFFVAVGMLFDPSILIRSPWAVLGTLLIIILGKSLAAWLIVLAFGYPQRIALIISASLAQIGEFAFMLAELGMGLGLLSHEGRDLILAGAILSIVLNPLWFLAVDWLQPRRWAADRVVQPLISLKDHVILIGHGRVGSLVANALRERHRPFVVIEDNSEIVGRLRAEGVTAILGNAEAPGVLQSAKVMHARWLISAIPNVYEAGEVIARARSLNPSIEILARAHSDVETEYLRQRGAQLVIMGEEEIARKMIKEAVESD
jgi:monovalent cation:H+ antiporter-2, CPA2 family